MLNSDLVTSSISVLAVGAAAMPNDVKAGLDAGFLSYHANSFDVDAFLSKTKDVLQNKSKKPSVNKAYLVSPRLTKLSAQIKSTCSYMERICSLNSVMLNPAILFTSYFSKGL